MRTTTENLAAALHVLANDIQSDDGVANAAILEAALRLEEQEQRIKHLIQLGLETSQYGLTKHRELWEKECEL